MSLEIRLSRSITTQHAITSSRNKGNQIKLNVDVGLVAVQKICKDILDNDVKLGAIIPSTKEDSDRSIDWSRLGIKFSPQIMWCTKFDGGVTHGIVLF